MRIALNTALVVLVSTAAFFAGRLTAPAPSFEANPVVAEGDELEAAWQDFGRAQQQTLQMFQPSEFSGRSDGAALGGARRRRALVGRVRDALPSDTPEFGPDQRAQQIRRRRAEAQQRFPG